MKHIKIDHIKTLCVYKNKIIAIHYDDENVIVTNHKSKNSIGDFISWAQKQNNRTLKIELTNAFADIVKINARYLFPRD